MKTTFEDDCVEGEYMTTISGRNLYPLNPNPKDICIDDIAHALSNCARWGGHTNKHFSVAQHSVLVSYLCDPNDALIGLFHDAAEAYIGDMIRPVKYLPAIYAAYKPIETKVTQAIADALGIPSLEKTESVERADQLCLASEFITLRDAYNSTLVQKVLAKYPDSEIHIIKTIWSPKKAKKQFLKRYTELIRSE